MPSSFFPSVTGVGVILTLLVLMNFGTNAKICGSVHIRNDMEQLEKLRECRIIVGDLQIVLLQKSILPDAWNDNRYTFPNLTEIYGYMLLYRVFGLTSVGQIFPHLRVIKGLRTFTNHALILYSLKHLQEIGLKSLKRIERGSVMIGHCEHLCYYETIDWKKLGTEATTVAMLPRNCLMCSEACKGNCWSYSECQDFEDREKCPNFRDDGNCVHKCPDNKLKIIIDNKNSSGTECITMEQCEQIIDSNNNPWFSYQKTCRNECPTGYQKKNKTCVYCGDNCVYICQAKDIVSSLSSVEAFHGCTHINGSLRFNIKDSKAARELEYNMGRIKEIWGYLEVRRSSEITSLEFLKSLELIRGDTLDNNNSLIVLDNQNLNKLWTFDSSFKVKIRRGELLFHYNPQLCYSDIVILNNLTVKMKLTQVKVSEDNGNQRLCQEFFLNTDKSIIHSTNATLYWQKFVGKRPLRGYFVYYIEKKKINVKLQNVCTSNAWDVIFTTDNFVTLQELNPFTNYSFYLVVSFLDDKAQHKTKVHNFTTLSDDPTAPMEVEVLSYNSTAMQLTWRPPFQPRGVLDKYIVTFHKLPKDDVLLETRNYCKRPVIDDNDGLLIKEEPIPPSRNADKKEKILLASEQCDCGPNFTRILRSLDFLKDKSDYNGKNAIVQFESKFTNIYIPYVTSRDRDIYHFANPSDVFENDTISMNNNSSIPQSIIYEEHVVSADKNTTLITGLDHFSTYVFYITACNKNRTARQQCSEVVKIYNRTRRSSTADNLNGYYVAATKDGIVLNWSNPDHPNSLIVSYTVEWKSEESEESPSNNKCIRPKDLTNVGYTLHLLPGGYHIRVRANTLAGPGEFTTFQRCYYGNPYNTDYVLIIVLSCVLVIIIASGIFIYLKYKRRKELEDIHLIQSINPDYCGATYVEDEWEVERTDVDINNSLGKGSFGIVYSGFLKSRQMPCAIKTININSTLEEKMEFLNEASVMKAFSNAHHVIKLLGVVSRGPSPFVIMELMARGDLKTFLRKSRESSQSIGCNEMYRMAIEIADGMAYLAAKKFIHRDLAARNCMVSADHTIKIGDFGMARDIYETDYYRKDSKGLLPVRWMAPESLADGVFTTDSDVWSYGVVLWEMVTLAEQPYQGLASAQVLQFVIARGRLDRPPECPDLLYEIMEVCWRWHPNKRPQFTDIVAKLEKHVSEDFLLMSFYHSREGNEHRLNAKERPFNPPAMAQALRGSKNAFALYHRSDENIDLYNDDCDPMNYPSNPIHNENLLADYAYEEEHGDVLPGSNGYASLSKPSV